MGAGLAVDASTLPPPPRSFLNYWEKKYKTMWEVDKEGYIRRYEKAQKGLSSFEADIQRYLQLQEEVQVSFKLAGKDTTTCIRGAHMGFQEGAIADAEAMDHALTHSANATGQGRGQPHQHTLRVHRPQLCSRPRPSSPSIVIRALAPTPNPAPRAPAGRGQQHQYALPAHRLRPAEADAGGALRAVGGQVHGPAQRSGGAGAVRAAQPLPVLVRCHWVARELVDAFVEHANDDDDDHE